ncbi:hypothetical protein RchiOBHm_Chr1g0315101 [Rosa chinensis]|uniref:Uncharacterized protein n=1 Tax=Rosa chinensis TaxID=74649 RepID=A0A2P6S7E6_ROSCH|nr:hypothetical protein RchiOBHm_Chr1g0315101 [Rosa chinensis]
MWLKPNPMMCDSLIVQTKLSQSDSLCKYSHSSISCDSEFQSEVVKDDSLSKVSNLDEGIERLGSCNKSSYPTISSLNRM